MEGGAPELATWNIVALDPSTDWTGAVLLEQREDGRARVLGMAAVCGDWSPLASCDLVPRRNDLAGVAGRIYRSTVWLRRNLYAWKKEIGHTLDVVAFEDVRKFGPSRGALTGEALIGATFAYLAVPELQGLPLMPIVRMSACAATGATAIYREAAGKTKREQDAKRARLKAAVQAGVIERLGLCFHPNAYSPEEVEAICDAAAVGLAAGKKLIEAEQAARAKAAQRTLRIGGRGKARKALA